MQLYRHKKSFSFYIVCILFLYNLSYAVKADVVFVLHNAGETFALLPTIKKLNENNVPNKIFALDPAYDILLKENITHVEKITYKQIKDKQLKLTPKLIITGTYSEEQYELLRSLKRENNQVLTFYDSFHIPQKNSINDKIMSESNIILVPNNHLHAHLTKNHPLKKILVIGHPTIEVWQNIIKKHNTNAILDELKLPHNNKIVLLIGGYGKDYEKAFTTLIHSLTDLKKYTTIISIHPKASGTFEQNILENINNKNFIVANKSIPTPVLVNISDTVICQQSTACIFAYALGFSVVYFDNPESNYSNWLIDEKIIPKTVSKEQLLTSLNMKHCPNKSILTQKATDMIYNIIIQAISEK